ncbi:MAG: serine/threonine-protein kinase, partial [Deltaproteobacteria bacterium]|nr:serine/threonine-protein kinase [Deltaproteobacteria bacterium]
MDTSESRRSESNPGVEPNPAAIDTASASEGAGEQLRDPSIPRPKLAGPGELAKRNRVFAALFGMPSPPQTLGRYVVLGTLGRGGMGTVLEAFDRTLDRKVAVKVLHQDLAERHAARLLREAQAMAKLSHPNVVQVYEADTVGGQAFVVMERVAGQPLRKWMDQQPRPDWRRCVEMFIQVGRGLAAAHAEGLIHRDFKPSNAIIDEGGRARVLDFGLARRTVVDPRAGRALEGTDGDDDQYATGPADSETFAHATTPDLAQDAPALDLALTETGAVLGTPAYMPLEQMKGQEADARSDQFSFCVSLFEAVYGERPFEGKTTMALLVSMSRDEIRPAPKGSGVPEALRAVLLRGLALEPEQRWPSMDVLLSELGRLVAPRNRRGLTLGLVVGLIGLGGLVATPRWLEMQDRCTGAASELDGIWDRDQSRRVHDSIVGTDHPPYAADTWGRIEPLLEGYTQAWVTKHAEICEATTVRGEQTAEVMELRMGCLRDRKIALDAVVRILVEPAGTAVADAVELVEGLPSLRRCDDVHQLQQQRLRVPPPQDPSVQSQVEALRDELAFIRAAMYAGQHVEALERVGPVVQQAEDLGYEPLLAQALVLRGNAADRNDHLSEAEADLARAFAIAARHGYDEVAVLAVDRLTWVVGFGQARHERGLVWGQTALALASGPNVEPAVEAQVRTAVGSVLAAQGKSEQALVHLQRALAVYEQELGHDHSQVAGALLNVSNVLSDRGELSESLTHQRRALKIYEQRQGSNHTSVADALTNIGVILHLQSHSTEALVHHRRALAIYERALGRDHSKLATVCTNIGVVLADQGELVEALAHHQRAMAILEQTVGQTHPSIASLSNNVGSTLQQLGRHAEALHYYQRSLAISERELGKDHITVAMALGNIGLMLEHQGEHAEALTTQQRALAIKERALGKQHPGLAPTLYNIGHLLQVQGESAGASAHQQRALAVLEAALGHDHPNLAYPLVGLATVAVEQREFETARMHAQRAVELVEAGQVAPPRVAEAQFTLARALWPARGERERAHGLAQQARRTL